MPFYRFEDFESNSLTPDLSTGKAPVIEGKYIYFCLLERQYSELKSVMAHFARAK